MKKSISTSNPLRQFPVFLFLIGACLAVCCANDIVCARETGTLRNFKQGDKLPQIKLPLIDDRQPKTYILGNGKPSVIMFFSIKPEFRRKRSLAMLSSLSAISDKYKGQIEVLSIYSDEKQVEVVKSYIQSSSLKIKVLKDPVKNTYNDFGVFMMPLVIMTDSKGNLHQVIPYTFNVREIIDGNIKLLLGQWDKKQLQASLRPKEKVHKSNEEKEYIRRINYGRIMLSKKMYAPAVREFSTATKVMPKRPDAYIELGFTFIASKKYAEAEAPFRAAQRIDAESDDAISGLGLSHYGLGQIEKALPELENAFISKKPRLDVIIALADIYEKKGNNTKANRLNKLAVARLMKLYEQRWK